jgi:hypothetical protein
VLNPRENAPATHSRAWYVRHPARLLYIFMIALLINLLYSLLQAILFAHSWTDVLALEQVQKTLLGQAATSYPYVFWTALALSLVAAGVGWYIDRNMPQPVSPQSVSADATATRSAQAPLIRGADLTPANLGDEAAASFTYVKQPVEKEYDEAASVIQKIANGGKDHGVIIVGNANSGKTRMANELIHRNLADWQVLRWTQALTTEELPPPSAIRGRKLVVLIDDLQDYAADEADTRDAITGGQYERDPLGQPIRRMRSAVSYERGPQGQRQPIIIPEYAAADVGDGAIGGGQYERSGFAQRRFASVDRMRSGAMQTMLEGLRRDAGRMIVLATCRAEDLEATRVRFRWLFGDLKGVQLPKFDKSPEGDTAREVIEAFREAGSPYGEEDWDGTAGSLVLGPRK